MGASQENPLSALLIYGYDLSRKIPSPNLSQLPPISVIHKRLLTASKVPILFLGRSPFPSKRQMFKLLGGGLHVFADCPIV